MVASLRFALRNGKANRALNRDQPQCGAPKGVLNSRRLDVGVLRDAGALLLAINEVQVHGRELMVCAAGGFVAGAASAGELCFGPLCPVAVVGMR
jgi:hypothetical protein